MNYPWQQQQWSRIEQLIASDRVPHALLMTGAEGLGKADFATAIANTMLCEEVLAGHQACGRCRSCQLLKAGTHPDLYRLKPTPPATSKSANPVLSIKIDDVRELCEQLNQSSQFGRYRVAIIEQANCLTLSAANSLLKTLEEPGQDVLIVLITARPHRLPVTIRSRCQQIRFTQPEKAQAVEWLQQNNPQGHSTENLLQAVRMTNGSPLAALVYLDELEHYQLLSEAMTASVMGKNPLDYSSKLAKFAKIKTLEGMLSWVSDLGKIQVCGPDSEIVNEQYRRQLQALAKKVSSQRLFRFHEQLNFNLTHSAITLNEQLLWENLLLSWDNL